MTATVLPSCLQHDMWGFSTSGEGSAYLYAPRICGMAWVGYETTFRAISSAVNALSLVQATTRRRRPLERRRVHAHAPCHRGVCSSCDGLGCCPSRSASVPLVSESRCTRRGGSGVDVC